MRNFVHIHNGLCGLNIRLKWREINTRANTKYTIKWHTKNRFHSAFDVFVKNKRNVSARWSVQIQIIIRLDRRSIGTWILFLSCCHSYSPFLPHHAKINHSISINAINCCIKYTANSVRNTNYEQYRKNGQHKLIE